MNHARTSGASVYELTKVTSISFCSTDSSKPVSVTWTHTPLPTPISPPSSPSTSNTDKPSQGQDGPLSITGTTTFDYLIDATGRAGIMSTQYLKNRYFNVSLKNVAFWGYWVDVGSYGVGTSRHGAPWFEALTGEAFALKPVVPRIVNILFFNSYHRRIWMGMVYSSPQRDYISWNRHEPEYIYREAQSRPTAVAFRIFGYA